MNSQKLPEGRFQINIPSSIYEYCHYLKEGSKMELTGINGKYGKDGASYEEAVTFLAQKRDDVLSFIFLGSAMGSVFEERLTDYWSCDIQSATIEDFIDDIPESITKEPVNVPAEESSLETDPTSPSLEMEPIPVAFLSEACPSNSPSTLVIQEDLKISLMETDQAESPSNSEPHEMSDILTQDTGLDLQEALELKESVENLNANMISVHVIVKDEPLVSEDSGDAAPKEETLENDNNSPEASPDRMPLQCPTCNKIFKLKTRLEKHMKVHSGDKSHQCPVCGKTFNRRYTLERHSSTHAKGKSYTCSRCGEVSNNFTDHQNHTRSHKDERPFKCETCSKSFYQHSKLVIHTRLHTGERPFLCSVCAKGFIENSQLKIHSRIHTGEKPYKCNICGKGFSQAGYLQIHKRTHTGERPYKCKVCDVGFVDATHLKTHLRIHTGEKPYVCNICSKAFCRSEGLRIHMQNHTGEKRHVCSICGDSFKRADNLKSHLRRHTYTDESHVCVQCGKKFKDEQKFRLHMETHLKHVKPEEVQQYILLEGADGIAEVHVQ